MSSFSKLVATKLPLLVTTRAFTKGSRCVPPVSVSKATEDLDSGPSKEAPPKDIQDNASQFAALPAAKAMTAAVAKLLAASSGPAAKDRDLKKLRGKLGSLQYKSEVLPEKMQKFAKEGQELHKQHTALKKKIEAVGMKLKEALDEDGQGGESYEPWIDPGNDWRMF